MFSDILCECRNIKQHFMLHEVALFMSILLILCMFNFVLDLKII